MPYKNNADRIAYLVRRARERRIEWFQFKICVVCGSDKDLELDHVDRETKVSHRIWGWTKRRFDSEIVKCQVLCQRCHREKTSRENKREIVHGHTGYTRGCRCSTCKNSHYVYNRQWRLSRGNAQNVVVSE